MRKPTTLLCKSQKEFIELSEVTKYVLGAGKNKSIIKDGNKKYEVDVSAFEIINDNCKNFGSTLEGRVVAAYEKTKISYKTPIILSEMLRLVVFPTTNCKSDDCMWFFLRSIENYEKTENGNTRVYFKDRTCEEFNVTYFTFNGQFMKALQVFINFFDKAV